MYIITVHKDYGNNSIQATETFDDEEEAYDFFEHEIRSEFDYEIVEGLVSDQEIQNIINNEYYRFESETKEILIKIEELESKYEQKD